MALFPNPPAWQANTAYRAGIDETTAPSWTVSPNWPPNEPPNNYVQPTVSDGGVTWVLVAYNDE